MSDSATIRFETFSPDTDLSDSTDLVTGTDGTFEREDGLNVVFEGEHVDFGLDEKFEEAALMKGLRKG